MIIKVLKTNEIDDILWSQIVDGFNESFDHNSTIESFKKGFSVKNQWGYAYHSIAIDEKSGELIGFNTYTPSLYNNNLKFLVSGSTFVRKKFRKDIFIYLDMVNELKKKCIEDGFVVGLGVPNHNSLDYSLKFLGGNLVGYLDYYLLPLKPSKCLSKSFLLPLDCICRFFIRLYVSLYLKWSNLYNSREKEVKYSLVVDDDYLKSRFNKETYNEYLSKEGKYRAYYRIVDENGIRTAYLMDFRENSLRTKRALSKAVSYILKKEFIDAILFVGYLRLHQHILFKIPKKNIPKPLPLTYGVFKKEDRDRLSDLSDLNNWNFSLMNFDAR